MPYRPPVHCLVYAPAGGWKSTFASTWTKPMLVLAFDPFGKMGPYYRRGIPSPEVEGEFGQGVVVVASKKDSARTIVQCEFFHDDDVDVDKDGNTVIRPVAMHRLFKRLPSLYEEVKAGMWKTVVVDTLSAMTLSARYLHQYDLHKHEKDSRKWYAQAKDEIEKLICSQFVGALRGINYLVLCHESKDKDELAGVMVGEPAAPGTLSKQDGLPSKFPEMYYIQASRDPQSKEIIRKLQTRPDTRHNAMSVLLNAPDGCECDYNALWTNYDAQ